MILDILEFATVASILAATPSLGGLYIVCLIVGGGLLLISTVFGGHSDTDVDVEVDVHVDADADPAGISLSEWFSIRFVVYFAASFGLIGTVLTYALTTSPGWTLGWAALGGLAIGQAVHQLMRLIQRTAGNSQALEHDFVDQLGRVTVAIQPDRRGEVAVQVRGRERYIRARAKRTDEKFQTGDSVAVVAYRGGVATVVSRKEFEFINDTPTGDNA